MDDLEELSWWAVLGLALAPAFLILGAISLLSHLDYYGPLFIGVGLAVIVAKIFQALAR